MQNLIPVTSIVVVEAEPRIRDLDLAQWLGFARLADIRNLIVRNSNELATFGSFPHRTENPGKQGGRPGKAYYLNEEQALVICALSRTPKAAEVRKALIDVFMAYRSGKLVHVTEHRRRLPKHHQTARDTFEGNKRFVRSFADNPTAILDLIAGMMTRLDQLESQ